jgi:PIN domain nuclease of toxin-antitoxin system
MSNAVLDSSAVLALLQAEPGGDVVRAHLPGAFMSTVNFAEIATKFQDRGIPSQAIAAAVKSLGVVLIEFTHAHALAAADLRPTTRALGLSLGDRACLALALSMGIAAITADAAWTKAPGVHVILIR